MTSEYSTEVDGRFSSAFFTTEQIVKKKSGAPCLVNVPGEN